MALLSGEVETPIGHLLAPLERGSGWLCYPGKLKPVEPDLLAGPALLVFRMALLSGEVETSNVVASGGRPNA